MQQISSSTTGRPKQANANNLLPKEQAIRYPKPPSMPRSQSSKDLQQTPKNSPHLRAGRRILYRSYSTPNVSSSDGVKLPKTTRNSLLGKGARCSVVNGFHGQTSNNVKGQTLGKERIGLPCNGFKGCDQCKEHACRKLREQTCNQRGGNAYKVHAIYENIKGQTLCKESRGLGFKAQHLSHEYKRNNFWNGFNSCNSIFEANIPEIKELPDVYTKPKPSLPKCEDDQLLFVKPLEMAALTEGKQEEPVSIYSDDTFDFEFSSNHCKLKPTNRNAVFFIDHDDGRLHPTTNLRSVPEEPEHQPHLTSPWQCSSTDSKVSVKRCFGSTNQNPSSIITDNSPFQIRSNESKVAMNELLESSYQEPGGNMTQKSPWHYHGDDKKYRVVDELFDSDEEGLVIKQRGLGDDRLDADKKAMINSWIHDVTMNTSIPNK